MRVNFAHSSALGYHRNHFPFKTQTQTEKAECATLPVVTIPLYFNGIMTMFGRQKLIARRTCIICMRCAVNQIEGLLCSSGPSRNYASQAEPGERHETCQTRTTPAQKRVSHAVIVALQQLNFRSSLGKRTLYQPHWYWFAPVSVSVCPVAA